MIDRKHELPITRQCLTLNLSRSSVYYRPRPVSEADLALMRRLDEMHLEYPFAGARMLRGMLLRERRVVGRRHLSALMKKMGMNALYRKPNTSKPHSGDMIYPYLLRNLKIDRPDQVWAADITYIPMKKGFVYLFAVMDWYSRRVLAWKLSNTLSADFCVEAVEEAMRKYGCPEVFNTDQGSQFTGHAFTGLLKKKGVSISMDGKGRWRDNVFVERLWKSVKYEEVYLKAYESVSDAQRSLEKYLDFYNHRRPHSAHGGSTPDETYQKDRKHLPDAA
jgi:putative transposase